MEEIQKENEKRKRKRIRIKPKMILTGILLLCVAGGAIRNAILSKRETTIVSSSTLTDMINISELSTSKFIYNGIAQTYKDDKKEKVKCNIKYYATVKAGINMKDVTFEIDNKNKTIKPKLPEIKITSNVVDSNKMDFIPYNSRINLKEAIAACEKDVERESKKETKLTETAKESLKANIKGLLIPIINKQGYTVVWD